MTTVLCKNFNVDNITFSAPTTTKTKTRSINLIYDGITEWYLQCNTSIPFQPYDSNFCITLDSSMEVVLRNLEKIIIKNIAENSLTLFNKQLTEVEICNKYYTSMINSINKDFLPFMKVSFPTKYDIYDTEGKVGDKLLLVKQTKIKIVMKFAKLYIKEDNVKCIIELRQAKIANEKPKLPSDSGPPKLGSYAFLDEN